MARRPARINAEATRWLRSMVHDLADKPPPGVTLYVVDQHRGRAYYAARVATVPLWAMKDPREGKALQYLAHELAHIAAHEADGTTGHGGSFMTHMKRLCPPKYWHFELSYKPRLASAAGITKPK